MKKIILLLVAIIPALAFSQKEKMARITGTLKNVKDTIDWVYIQYFANNTRTMDSTMVTDNKYSFTVNISEPVMASFRSKNSANPKARITRKSVASAFIEPGAMSIISVDSFSNVTVIGSKSNDEIKKLDAQSKSYADEIQAAGTKYTEARKNKNEAEMKKYEDEIEALQNKMNEEVYGNYAKNNPSSPLALYALGRFAGYDIPVEKVEPIFNGLPADVRNSQSGVELKNRIDITKATGIGKIAPDFSQNDTLGHLVSLSSLRGKYVLVDFWASWCGPCRAENPNIVKAFNKYKGKGFHILGVSLDQPGAQDRWIKAIHDDNLTWTQVSDLKYWDNAVAKQYAIRAIPQNFLLDPQGKIIAKNLNGETLDQKLKSILGE